jgi:F-type H+-transporting ATPase subunit epsilon
MAEKLHLSLVTPEAELFEGEVDQVVAPGSEGEFGVLAHHAPFMTTLAEGPVVILDGTSKRVFQVRGGFADVSEDGMTILAESAEEYLETVH